MELMNQLKMTSVTIFVRLENEINLDILLNELNNFGIKIDIKNGTLQEEHDSLKIFYQSILR